MDEKDKIEHQIELATRAAGLFRDETIVQRLTNFADELRQRLLQMMRRPKVRARAYELWEQAGHPPDRDLEFWLEAERQIAGQGRKGGGLMPCSGPGRSINRLSVFRDVSFLA